MALAKLKEQLFLEDFEDEKQIKEITSILINHPKYKYDQNKKIIYHQKKF